MKISKQDVLATLVIFVILVLVSEIIARIPKTWFAGQDEQMLGMVQELIRRDMASRDGDPSQSLALIRQRYNSLPIGTDAGEDAAQERLERMQALFPTREAFFPVLAKNYLVQFFVDTSVEVDVTDGMYFYHSFPKLDTPSPFEEMGGRQLEQRLVLGKKYVYASRLYMLEYLPVVGGFKANVAFRRLSTDPDYVLTGTENLNFEPWDADERKELGSRSSRGEEGVEYKILWWGNLDKKEGAGTFVYRAFVFPDQKMQKTIGGAYLASPPVIIRVSPVDEKEGLEKESETGNDRNS